MMKSCGGFASLVKNSLAESFGGKKRVKGNRHTEPQRGVSERNRRVAAALSAEMGFLSRSITRRSDQNCKINNTTTFDFAIL